MCTDRESQPEAGESFQQRLQRLRLKIDSLPEAQRPHLLDLAETIARQAKKGTVPICRNGPEGASHKWGLSPFSQHRQLQNRVSHHHDAD